MNTADYLLETGRGDTESILTDCAYYTYDDVRDASAGMAAELMTAGVRSADRVGILANNSLF